MRRFIAVALAALAALAAPEARAADDVKITATATPDRLPPGHTFRLKITVEGKGIQTFPDPQLPRLKSFEIVGRSSSQRISMSGFSFSGSKTVTYQVLAPKEGVFEIPPTTLEHEGKKYETEPITITVDPAAPAPQAPQTARRRPGGPFPPAGPDPFDNFLHPSQPRIEKDDLMVKMETDRETAVPYEQVTATFSFYQAVDLWGSPDYTKPKFEGFWVEGLPFENGKSQKKFTETVDGKKYVVTKIRYALFPIAPGVLTIDPASLAVSTGPWARRVRLETKPLPLEVVPFPEEGKPDDFLNAVTFSLSVRAEVEPERVQLNGSVSFRVEIKGEGYLLPMDAPKLPPIEGFEAYEPKVTEKIDKANGKVVTIKTIEYPLIAVAEGESIVPPISIPAYDPERREYFAKKTEPVAITALPGLAPSRQVAGGGAVPHGGDIRYIKPDAVYLDDYSTPVYRRWVFGVALVIPILALGLAAAHARKRRRLMTDTAYARALSAASVARRRLEEAGTASAPEEFYPAVDQAVRGYLADKWNVTAPSVNRALVTERLGGTDAGLAGGFAELLEAVERERYSPSGGDKMSAHLARAGELVEVMERLDK